MRCKARCSTTPSPRSKETSRSSPKSSHSGRDRSSPGWRRTTSTSMGLEASMPQQGTSYRQVDGCRCVSHRPNRGGMKLSRLPLLVLLLCSCAKDRGDDDGVLPPADSGVNDTGAADTGVNLGFNAREVAAEIAAAQCAYFTRCIPEYYDANAIDEAQCRTDTTDSIASAYEDLAPVISAGRIMYNEIQKTACVSELASADCITGLSDGNPCDLILAGTQQANQPCFFTAECGQNLYCNRAQGAGSCGACAQAPAKGANCDPFTPCVDNARCLDVGQAAPMYVCIPIDAPEGGQCLTVQTGLCQGALSCVGDQTNGFMCQAPGGSGAQ